MVNFIEKILWQEFYKKIKKNDVFQKKLSPDRRGKTGLSTAKEDLQQEPARLRIALQNKKKRPENKISGRFLLKTITLSGVF